MSTTVAIERLELNTFPSQRSHSSGHTIELSSHSRRPEDDSEQPPDHATEAVPDGGYGWVVVIACSVLTFWFGGWSGAWGVVQTALLHSDYLSPSVDASTISFVGSLAMACSVLLGVVSVRLTSFMGARASTILGVILVSASIIITSFTVDNIGGLFCTAGALIGIGTSILYTTANTIPAQWFSTKLGTANGLVKLGGGIGAAVCSIAIQALIDVVGIPWTLRMFGFGMLITGLPAAWFVKERTASTHVPWIDLRMFKNATFTFLFMAGAIGVFALFVPPFFLPLFAHSIGLSPSVGAGIVAAFQTCAAIGRIGAGVTCDKLGSLNTVLLTMALNAISMLAIWPISSSLAPLIVFAAINGVANGAFFVAMPTAIASLTSSGLASVAMSMCITGWTVGYLMGSPIAGILISASGAGQSKSINPYRGAIFYAGGIALASAICVLLGRMSMNRKLFKKV
jgi:MFS transporter, MCT family, solute carrier family 16 (monocarboxylic acid transporters), member 3